MTVVLPALMIIGAAGLVVGVVAHLAVAHLAALLGGTLAWMGALASWLTAQAFVCSGCWWRFTG